MPPDIPVLQRSRQNRERGSAPCYVLSCHHHGGESIFFLSRFKSEWPFRRWSFKVPALCTYGFPYGVHKGREWFISRGEVREICISSDRPGERAPVSLILRFDADREPFHETRTRRERWHVLDDARQKNSVGQRANETFFHPIHIFFFFFFGVCLPPLILARAIE